MSNNIDLSGLENAFQNNFVRENRRHNNAGHNNWKAKGRQPSPVGRQPHAQQQAHQNRQERRGGPFKPMYNGRPWDGPWQSLRATRLESAQGLVYMEQAQFGVVLHGAEQAEMSVLLACSPRRGALMHRVPFVMDETVLSKDSTFGVLHVVKSHGGVYFRWADIEKWRDYNGMNQVPFTSCMPFLRGGADEALRGLSVFTGMEVTAGPQTAYCAYRALPVGVFELAWPHLRGTLSTLLTVDEPSARAAAYVLENETMAAGGNFEIRFSETGAVAEVTVPHALPEEVLAVYPDTKFVSEENVLRRHVPLQQAQRQQGHRYPYPNKRGQRGAYQGPRKAHA